MGAAVCITWAEKFGFIRSSSVSNMHAEARKCTVEHLFLFFIIKPPICLIWPTGSMVLGPGDMGL